MFRGLPSRFVEPHPSIENSKTCHLRRKIRYIPGCSRSTLKAKVPYATMVKLEQTGHFVPMDRPDETVNEIINFYNNIPVNDSS